MLLASFVDLMPVIQTKNHMSYLNMSFVGYVFSMCRPLGSRLALFDVKFGFYMKFPPENRTLKLARTIDTSEQNDV